MNWCRFHGILTPASLSTGPGKPICGYPFDGKNYPVTTGCCISPVYDLTVNEIDEMVVYSLKRHEAIRVAKIAFDDFMAREGVTPESAAKFATFLGVEVDQEKRF